MTVGAQIRTLNVEVANPAVPARTERVELAVHAGVLHSIVPAPVLERLGIRPFKTEAFRRPNGTLVVRRRGPAFFRFGDYVGASDVVFGEEGNGSILGELGLTALGLAFDPIKRTLEPLELTL